MTLTNPSLTADIGRIGGQRRLFLHAADDVALGAFEGQRHDVAGRRMLDGELSAHNARALRESFAHLTPVPVGRGISAGVGDRLGLAASGHVGAFQLYGTGVFPVFAQQSLRELDRLGRPLQDVIDAATFGGVAAGWESPVGADLDHIRTIDDIERGVNAGFTTYTLDPGDYVRSIPAILSRDAIDAVDWAAFGENEDTLRARYAGKTIDLAEFTISPTDDDVLRAAAKYADAVTFVGQMYHRLKELAEFATEVEIAVDETEQQTTLFEHHFIVTELSRRGVTWVGFAPRYIDGFEKGVEFGGDLDALVLDVRGHTEVARIHGEYKLSLHSGSDKFSIYERVIAAAEGRIHLKTSGTSYLTALEVIAVRDTALFREIWRESVLAYEQSRASYQVSAAATVEGADVHDSELLSVVADRAARQMLHVGYGAVLTRTDAHGKRDLAQGVERTLLENDDEYRIAIQRHLGRHLVPFSQGAAK